MANVCGKRGHLELVAGVVWSLYSQYAYTGLSRSAGNQHARIYCDVVCRFSHCSCTTLVVMSTKPVLSSHREYQN